MQAIDHATHIQHEPGCTLCDIIWWGGGVDSECCPGAHFFCYKCGMDGHQYGPWEKQRLFAFEERVCKCCGHAESRVLPLGEEEES